MRLISDIDDHFVVVDGKGNETPLGEFVARARQKKGLTRGKLSIMAGLIHPTLYNVESGLNYSAKPALLALEELGYTFTITEPKDVK